MLSPYLFFSFFPVHPIFSSLNFFSNPNILLQKKKKKKVVPPSHDETMLLSKLMISRNRQLYSQSCENCLTVFSSIYTAFTTCDFMAFSKMQRLSCISPWSWHHHSRTQLGKLTPSPWSHKRLHLFKETHRKIPSNMTWAWTWSQAIHFFFFY
jgi:hypothetical protein